MDDDDHDDGSGGPATSRGRSLTSPSSTAPSLERTRNTRSNPTQNEITTTAIEAAGTDQWADTYPTPGGGGRLPPGAGLHANTARSPESTAEAAAAASTAAANSGSSIPATATSTPREPPAIAVRIVVADFKMLHAAPDGRFHDAGRGGEDVSLQTRKMYYIIYILNIYINIYIKWRSLIATLSPALRIDHPVYHVVMSGVAFR